MSSDPVVISSYARTPVVRFQGVLSATITSVLRGIAARAEVARAKLDPTAIERIYLGCVLAAGLGQAPAWQAAPLAGLPHAVQATTINKMCGSGMQAMILAAEAICGVT